MGNYEKWPFLASQAAYEGSIPFTRSSFLYKISDMELHRLIVLLMDCRYSMPIPVPETANDGAGNINHHNRLDRLSRFRPDIP